MALGLADAFRMLAYSAREQQRRLPVISTDAFSARELVAMLEGDLGMPMGSLRCRDGLDGVIGAFDGVALSAVVVIMRRPGANTSARWRRHSPDLRRAGA